MSTAAGFRIDQSETDNQTSLEARFTSKNDQPLRYLLGCTTCTRVSIRIPDTTRNTTTAPSTRTYDQYGGRLRPADLGIH